MNSKQAVVNGKTKFVTINIGRLRTVPVVIALFALMLLVWPSLWRGFPDAYFPYSGTVIAKGRVFLGDAVDDYEDWWDYYIVIQDSHGRKSRKYVGRQEYDSVEIGTFVVKKKGFGEWPLRPGQKTPYEMLHELEERNPKTKQQPQ